MRSAGSDSGVGGGGEERRGEVGAHNPQCCWCRSVCCSRVAGPEDWDGVFPAVITVGAAEDCGRVFWWRTGELHSPPPELSPCRHSRQSANNSQQCHTIHTTQGDTTGWQHSTLPDSHQIMSSFLMNSGSYGVSSDPKFPPSDEYSQSSYLQHSEYYNHMQAAHQYGYGMSGYPARDPMRDPMGYSNYYQQCSAMSQQQVLADINDKTVRHSLCPGSGIVRGEFTLPSLYWSFTLPALFTNYIPAQSSDQGQRSSDVLYFCLRIALTMLNLFCFF